MQHATVRLSKSFTGTRVPSIASWSYHLWVSLRRHRPLLRLHQIQIKILAVSEGQYKCKNTFFQGKIACWDYRCSANICDLCKTDIVITAQKQTKKVIRPNILTFPILAPVQTVICIPASVFDRLDQCEPPDVRATITKTFHVMLPGAAFLFPFLILPLSYSTCISGLSIRFWLFFMMCQIEGAKSPWKAKRTDGESLISSQPGAGWAKIQSRKEIKSSNKKRIIIKDLFVLYCRKEILKSKRENIKLLGKLLDYLKIFSPCCASWACVDCKRCHDCISE